MPTNLQNYVEYIKSLSKEERERELDNKVADSHHEIADADSFITVATDTNAQPFDVDDYQFKSDEIEYAENELRFSVSYHATGEQDEDKGFCGDKISGTAVVVIDNEGNVSYEDVTAELEDIGDDSDE